VSDVEIAYHPVLDEADLPEGAQVKVEIGPRQIGIYHHQGAVYALKNLCPHQGVDLHKGRIVDGCVICPSHQWKFSLETGTCGHAAKIRVATYPVKIEDGKVWIGLPA
jgi:NAD(P)H-dependent nitrite reductase small subunit